MKKFLIIALSLLFCLSATACKPDDPKPVDPVVEQHAFTIEGDCEFFESLVDHGYVIGSPDELDLQLHKPDENRVFLGYIYIDLETGEEFDFSQPIVRNTHLAVTITYEPEQDVDPGNDDPGDEFIDVESIDALNCRYIDSNGSVRYQISLAPGETFQIETVIYPQNASDKTVTYLAEKPSIASVSQSGLIKAEHYGRATIWPIASNGVNIGINVFIFGYEMNVSLTDENKVYKKGDVIDYKADVIWYRIDGNFAYDHLPYNAYLIIETGQADILSFDASSLTLTVAKEPSVDHTVSFRFGVVDDGIHYISNPLEIEVTTSVN